MSNIKKSVKELLEGLAQKTEDEHLKGTPDRVAKFWEQFLWHEDTRLETMTSFTATQDTMVVVGKLKVNSVCAHHLLPFMGEAYIGYFPGEKMAGLSKFQRVVNKYSHALTNQEQITRSVLDFIDTQLSPKGVIVVLKCTHTCMVLRGVESTNSITQTIAAKGAFLDPLVQANFLQMLKE